MKKATAICGCIKGGIFSREGNILKPFYKELVRFKLEFCKLLWSLFSKKHDFKLKQVQGKAIRTTKEAKRS